MMMIKNLLPVLAISILIAVASAHSGFDVERPIKPLKPAMPDMGRVNCHGCEGCGCGWCRDCCDPWADGCFGRGSFWNDDCDEAQVLVPEPMPCAVPCAGCWYPCYPVVTQVSTCVLYPAPTPTPAPSRIVPTEAQIGMSSQQPGRGAQAGYTVLSGVSRF